MTRAEWHYHTVHITWYKYVSHSLCMIISYVSFIIISPLDIHGSSGGKKGEEVAACREGHPRKAEALEGWKHISGKISFNRPWLENKGTLVVKVHSDGRSFTEASEMLFVLSEFLRTFTAGTNYLWECDLWSFISWTDSDTSTAWLLASLVKTYGFANRFGSNWITRLGCENTYERRPGKRSHIFFFERKVCVSWITLCVCVFQKDANRLTFKQFF